MIETHWSAVDGKLYYYDTVTRKAQWDRPSGHQITHRSLENQPWAGYIDPNGEPFWRNITNGLISLSMPGAFKEAMYAGAQQNPEGFYHNHMPPILREMPRERVILDSAAEDELLEYVLQLSLREQGNIESQAKEKGRADTPAKEKERRGREKNVLTSKAPPVDVFIGPNGIISRCNACFEKTTVNQAPCGCRYCPNCLAAIFMQALEDHGSSQPLCCGRILPMDLAAPILEEIGIYTETPESAPTKGKGRAEDRGKTKGRSKRKSRNVAENSRANTPAKAFVDCLICMGSFDADTVIKTPCQHYYCRDCMKRHFLEATRNESLYPPRCCDRDIPITIANVILNAEEQTAFTNKGREYRTKDRIYCSSKQCSAFIHPTQIRNDVGTCGSCRQRTCVFCKGAYHMGDCPKDKSTQEILKLAQKSGWRRCYNCKVMVELDKGCNHITCGCGAEFCYMCGAKWRTCGCQLWQQQNLEHVLEARQGVGYPYAQVQNPHPRYGPVEPGWFIR